MSVFTMNRYPVHMSHSNVVPSNSMERQRPPVVKQECSSENDDPDAKAIHSGHFMLSRIHGSYASDDDDDDEGAPDRSPVQSGFNFVDASKETCRTYKFGPKSTQTLAIDASLSKLFDKLALAYRYPIKCLFLNFSYKISALTYLQLTCQLRVTINYPCQGVLGLQNYPCRGGSGRFSRGSFWR